MYRKGSLKGGGSLDLRSYVIFSATLVRGIIRSCLCCLPILYHVIGERENPERCRGGHP